MVLHYLHMASSS
ncbi:hypothetical protein LINPERHAP2_LOCUS16616 [Linum perenne]